MCELLKYYNRHKILLSVSMAVSIFYLSGCRSNQLRDKDIFTIKNKHFSVTFIKPDNTNADSKLGCRFVRAGWIQELRMREDENSIFHTESLFKHHPAFGYTHEIYPTLDLGKNNNERLNVGVGIVKQDINKPYKSKALKIFPWHTVISREKGKLI